MNKIKKHDFVEIEYTGKLAEEGIIFDTTDEALAKKNNIFQKGSVYGPITICVGEKQILEGLDSGLEGKDCGKNLKIDISAEQGFGKKSGKLLKLVPLSVFRKQNVRPVPGLQLNIDGVVGTIKTVTGGRVIVDFNHPLSGHDIVYEVKVNKILTKKEDKIISLFKLLLNIEPKVVIKEGTAEIALEEELPPQLAKELEKKIVELVKVKKVVFKKEEKESKKEKNTNR